MEIRFPARGGDSTVNGGNTTMGGMTALLFAARDGRLDAVRALLEAGADVNQICAGDHTSPLVIAVSNGHYEVGKYLVEHGANPNLANVDGLMPLYAAIDMQYAPVSWAPNPLTVQEKVTHLELMNALLDHGADPNAKLTRKLWFRPTSHNQQWISTVGTTAFWRAAQATDVPAMKLAGGAWGRSENSFRGRHYAADGGGGTGISREISRRPLPIPGWRQCSIAWIWGSISTRRIIKATRRCTAQLIAVIMNW